MAHDVFICYSSKDKTTADAVCAVLESEGIRCWIAPRDILVGMSYGEAIVAAIHSAKALVLVFSGHANASPQIEREVERAINQRIPVIPLRIEDVAPDKALEYFLSTPHWLDAFTPPLDRHLRNLAGQIRRLINMPDLPVEAPVVAGLGASASPFKNVEAQVQAPKPPPPPPTPPPPPPVSAESAAKAATVGNAAISAAAFPSTGTQAPGGSVPPASTVKSATTPVAFFNNLDTAQRVGIGAGLLVVLIGVGWVISSGTGSSTPGPLLSTPGAPGAPNGNVAVNDGQDRVPGPGGLPVSRSPGPQVTDNGPSGTHLPADGDVVPGRGAPGSPSPSGTASAGPGADQLSNPAGGVYAAATGGDIASVLTDAGYDAQAAINNQGDPVVQATIQDLKFSVYFYRCNKETQPETCLDLQFHAAFTNDANVGDEAINKYNRDNRFGQAFFMQNGDIGLDMSATLQGGVSRQHIREVIDWWKVTLTGFTQKVGG